ncbi:uncharacterized protein LOC121370767 [Gigantopelta aegis]|uniref:uncharacterized protein LOC121370767 n=1 Tax=Gigantopelta aegis TaxID=1735272 RepID=UPI001B88B586|nr:uncharacterized protein LOC121370767 [Gigantopelta aegis]
MKNALLAIAALAGVVAMVNGICDVKDAKTCQVMFADQLSAGGRNMDKLCIAQKDLIKCLEHAACTDEMVFKSVMKEATKNMNALCSSGATMMVSAILVALLPILFN